MLAAELITILKNFPKKHILTLLLGLTLLISISLLGSKDFAEETGVSELTKPLSLTSLTENNIVLGDEKLLPAHPNPARSSDEITIGFTLPSLAAEVTLELFDINVQSRKRSSSSCVFPAPRVT